MPPPRAPSPPPAPSRPPGGASWLQRLALLVGVPLVFFGLLETGLRLAGFGASARLFIPDADKPGYLCPNPAFTDTFLPAHFGIRPLNFRLKQHKEPGEVRIFVLGESAAQGTPEPMFGFAAQLQAQLQAHYGTNRIEVINLGITAINSHVVYEVARQATAFEPDLFVIYLGNNEVIGPYGPGSAHLAAMPPLWVIRASVWARGTRTGQLLLRLLPRFGGGAKATEWRGMDTFTENTVRGDDPRLESVYGNFERNLRDIVAVAASADSKVVLSTVVANLKDSAPFASLHRPDLGPADLAAWQAAFYDARLAALLAENEGAEARLVEARRLDPSYAETHFLLGRLAEARGEAAAARLHYLDALHWDALRFRPDPRVNDIIRRVARDAGPSVRLVDAARVLGADADSAAPPSGHELLFEHVHLNWEGNRQLATLLAEACAQQLPGRPAQSGWLTPAECAAQVGYNDYGELNMLEAVTELTDKPPFTAESTYAELQGRLQAGSRRLHALVSNREGLRTAAAQLQQAVVRHPADAGLLLRLGNIEFEQRNFERALELVGQAMALKPRSPVLIAQKANLLLLLQRPNEAEELLVSSTRTDRYYFPTWQILTGLWIKQGHADQAKRALETLLAEMPANSILRMAYAGLLVRNGERGPAEQELRTILRNDPASHLALERLVQSCQQQGRTAEAEKLMVDYAPFQPRNAANHTRLAQLYATQGDTARMVVHLRALAESGPADASLCLELAQRLADLNRDREALVYARRGRLAAAAEANATLLQAADELLQRLTPH